MTNSSIKIFSHGSIYLIGNILRHIVSFIMLPIYTRVLTPADYGTIELLSMVIDFTGILFGLRIGEAIFRFYQMADDDKTKQQVVSTALILAILTTVLGFILISLLAGTINTIVFGHEEYRNLLILFALSLIFQQTATIPMIYLRAMQRPWLFISFSVMKLVLQLSLNIYLVVFLELSVKGVILSAVITGAIMSLLLGSYTLYKTGISFSPLLAKEIIAFSYPMILAGVISFYVTFGDRFFLKHYGTLSDVGLYALGYKFGFLLTFIGITPFNAIWDSERYNVYKRTNAKSTFQQVFIFFTIFTLSIAIGIAIFAKNALTVMANPNFWGAAQIVPIILLSYFIQGLTTYCNFGILLYKKTMIIAQSLMLSAVLITVLYFALIPKFGAIGAACSTAVTFAARFLYIYYRSKQLYDMELPWKKLYILIPPSILIVLVAMAGPEQIIWSISLNLLLYLFYFFLLTMLPVLPENQRKLLRGLLIRPWSFYRETSNFLKASA